ncbi:superfamily I DNA/RNA helicase/RecB family exonuclease [Trueperella bonasi]|uniref:DNA 3'-5' helicase n=1 Tax=Trueperella bonasi TaxID=312286 RepID=A0ABT9NEH1_9ACTO|nr:ATP-dependent DNA helicase [Trueperella bonasi]MDP9805774.1 superfamily I DNA/RNA helicase/RecB family exonuclease [Trueperella bonasi]
MENECEPKSDESRQWDASQQAVLGLRAPCVASVIGAPGTGKSALTIELAINVVRENPDAQVAVLSPDRRAASDLRNALSRTLGYLPATVDVRSITAFAFGIVSAYAQYVGRREPELLSGPDQDSFLKEYFDLILAGAVPGSLPEWAQDGEAARLPAYRAEFRDLITRAAELELSADDLARLGERVGEPIWQVGAHIMEGYEKALATQAGIGHQNQDIVDHARLLTQAAAMLQGWERAEVRGGKLGIAKPRWDWVIIDDVENSTLAVRALLQALKADGSSIVTFGDPDAAVQGFRGGVAHLPALLTRDEPAGGIGAQRMYLTHRYRSGGQIAQIAQRVTSGIHTAGAGKHRSADFVADSANMDSQGADGVACYPASARIFANEDEEIAYVATRMRRLHLLDAVPYSKMAVVTRSAGMHEATRRSFLRYGVPITMPVRSEPLREQRAVAALIDLLELALAEPAAVDVGQIEQVLTGVLFAIDPLDLRGLRRELRGWELADGGARSESELLKLVIDGGELLKNVPELHRAHKVIARIRAARERGALGEEVLWEAWAGVGVAEAWREQALGVGAHADAADSDLDAVISMFRIAQRQADRDPADAGIDVLLEALEDQDLPEDSIARTGALADEVALVTPSSTIGKTWDHVAILGLNEGVWPNTRLRNPLTKVPKLVNVVLGSEMAGRDVVSGQLVRDVIDDELRMLLKSITRARESVLVTASCGDGVQPSRFLSWLFPEAKEATSVASLLDTAGLTGELRQAMASGDEILSHAAQAILDGLARKGVATAQPQTWVDSFEPTTCEGSNGDVFVSPSRIESVMRCPLRSFFSSLGAESATDTRALDVGMLIHTLAEEFPNGPADAVRVRADKLIAQLDFEYDFEGTKMREEIDVMVMSLGKYLESTTAQVRVEQSGRETLSDEHGNVTVSARLDRLEADERGITVVDFKTSKSPLTKVEAKDNPQLRVYQWLVNRGAIEGAEAAGGAKLVYVRKPAATKDPAKNGMPAERIQPALSPEHMAQTETMIRNAGKVQRGGSFAAISNDMCRNCSFVPVCPAMGSGRIFS